jgi:hypothetical protein
LCDGGKVLGCHENLGGPHPVDEALGRPAAHGGNYGFRVSKSNHD